MSASCVRAARILNYSRLGWPRISTGSSIVTAPSLRRRRSVDDLLAQAAWRSRPAGFAPHCRRPRLAVISEIKRRSPSRATSTPTSIRR